MFDSDEPKIKCRKFTVQEQIEENWLANAFHRPPTKYFGDKPFYPWLPPEPVVNFMLNYKE